MEDRQEGAREGRVDGGQVVGTDTSAQGTRKHADTHALMCPKIQPVWGISVQFLTFLYLQFQALLCVCECVQLSQFVSGNLRQFYKCKKPAGLLKEKFLHGRGSFFILHHNSTNQID